MSAPERSTWKAAEIFVIVHSPAISSAFNSVFRATISSYCLLEARRIISLFVTHHLFICSLKAWFFFFCKCHSNYKPSDLWRRFISKFCSWIDAYIEIVFLLYLCIIFLSFFLLYCRKFFFSDTLFFFMQ